MAKAAARAAPYSAEMSSTKVQPSVPAKKPEKTVHFRINCNMVSNDHKPFDNRMPHQNRHAKLPSKTKELFQPFFLRCEREHADGKYGVILYLGWVCSNPICKQKNGPKSEAYETNYVVFRKPRVRKGGG